MTPHHADLAHAPGLAWRLGRARQDPPRVASTCPHIWCIRLAALGAERPVLAGCHFCGLRATLSREQTARHWFELANHPGWDIVSVLGLEDVPDESGEGAAIPAGRNP